jgi:DNA-binding MarR family transcriptional regulator
MTGAQKMELKRMTPKMWSVLRYVYVMQKDPGASLYGETLRSARTLERRGFLTISRRDRSHFAKLTEAGYEAMAEHI